MQCLPSEVLHEADTALAEDVDLLLLLLLLMLLLLL
jgi:hypothetical protein